METERIHNLREQDHSPLDRTCFMVEKQECSKRLMADNKDMAVPLKKRKHLHEELDSCDISTKQNLEKSENSEGIDMDFSLESENENCHESILSTNQGIDKECQIEFNLQSSVYVKADESAEWNRLNCFGSIMLNGSNSATFFAGGPIQSSAFSIMPPNRRGNQYIAIAAGNVINNHFSYINTENMNGIIQFWNLGSLHEGQTLIHLPSMELALCHDNGIITQMKWCPANCFDKSPSNCHLPRLGLLAVSSSNSNVYIYNVPQPDFMPKLKPTFPIYFTQPYMKLIASFGGPSYVTRKSIATCLEWEETGERIVAGYGNGSVCVWMLKTSPFTSNIAVKNVDQSYIIQPYLCFKAPLNCSPIQNLSFAPFSNNRWLAVLSVDKSIRVFDLWDTSASFQMMKTVTENNFMWGEDFCGIYCFPTLNNMGIISLFAKDYCTDSKRPDNQKGKTLYLDSSTNVAVSGNKDVHAFADMAGTVTVNFLKNIHKPLETSYLRYMLLKTEIMALDNVNLNVKASESKINIQGNVLSSENNPVSDTTSTLCAKMKQGSSSSSSSGFCSPKRGKTIVIETDRCFADDAAIFQKSPSETPVKNGFKDFNNNGMKEFLNKPPDSDEEKNDKMVKCSELSEDLMRDLLMMKISNLSKSSSHILPFNTSNNSDYCDSKGAKHLSDGASRTSLADSYYTGDTIVYPLEPCFCDTSHRSALKSIVPSEKLGLNEKRSNDFIICDTDDHRLSDRALNQFSNASNYSGDTIIYSFESYDFNETDTNFVKTEKPGAISQSLYKSVKENTFQDNLLHKVNQDEAVLCESKTNLFAENGSYFAQGKCEQFHTKKSLQFISEYDSATQSYSPSDGGKNFYQKDCLMSDFHLLHTEYLFENKFEDKNTSNELSEKDENPEDLSFEDLNARFGVILKNNMDECTEPLGTQENDVCVNYNPLSVIKTISWNPNEGCQSWMLLGGNSGICHLVYVRDFVADMKEKPQSLRRTKRQPQQKKKPQPL